MLRSTKNSNYINGEGFCCTDKSSKMTALDANIGNGNDDPEKLIFFYHSDHLGSTSYVTNLDGNVVQHVEYIPFGEVFIEERNNVWNTPYLFNSKELDEETGLYYYGARYYNPRESVWLSVDPLVEKTGTPYQYCYQNPVKFVDMFGMEGEDWVEKKNGDIYWDSKATSQATTKDGETYRGKEYSRYKDWRGVVDGNKNTVNSVVKEHYKPDKLMEYTSLAGNMTESLEFMKQLVDQNINYSQEGIRDEFSARGMSALDCSETVALFLYAYGSMPNMTSIYTGAMTTESDFRKSIGSNNIDGMGSIVPSAGDIFVWRNGNAGHTGIVYGYDKGNDVVTILEAIGHGGSNDNATNIRYGGTTKTNVTRTAIYQRTGAALQGHAGWKGYFRPK